MFSELNCPSRADRRYTHPRTCGCSAPAEFIGGPAIFLLIPFKRLFAPPRAALVAAAVAAMAVAATVVAEEAAEVARLGATVTGE